MDFEWDEDKRAANIGKHGLDFADVPRMDWENATVLPDDRFPYGEQRFWAFAMLEGGFIWSRSRAGLAHFVSSVFAVRVRKRSDVMANEKQKSRRDPAIPDDDIPEMTIDDFRRARPAAEIMPELIEAAKRARGRPRAARAKTHVSLRLDPEIVAAFRAEGPGWQGRINAVLARAISAKKKMTKPAKKRKAPAQSRRRRRAA